MNTPLRSKVIWSTYTALIIVVTLLALFMQGCSTLGYENVDTTRKAIVVANAEVRASNLLLQDLIQRQAINREDATSALNSLQTAKNHLQTALSAIDAASDPALAGTNLQLANVALSIAISLLAPLIEET